MTYFANNLRYLRRRANLSQSDLGDRIQTDYNTISRYESGKTTPKLEAIVRLAQVLGVSLEQLRSEDLTLASVPLPVPVTAGAPPAPYPRAPLAKPAKHPLSVTVELDGTLAGFERAVARLAAISDMVAATD